MLGGSTLIIFLCIMWELPGQHGVSSVGWLFVLRKEMVWVFSESCFLISSLCIAFVELVS